MTTNPIITPSEVIYMSGIGEQFPKCDLRTIFQIEYNEFVGCLGLDFYETLKGDLIQYNPTIYSGTQTYPIDSVVKYEGVIYKAIQESIGNLPVNTEYWVRAAKFATQCYEDLWCNFLGPYLAWVVVRNRLPFVWRQIKGEGVVEIFSNTFRSASIKDYQVIETATAREVDIAFSNMDIWMKTEHSKEVHTCFANYKNIADTCCGGCGLSGENCTCADNCDRESTGYGYNFG